MYKIMICLQKPEIKVQKEFAEAIEKVLQAYKGEFHTVRYALIDENVLPAKPLEIINTNHPKDAVISVWRNKVTGLEAFYEAIKQLADCVQVYEVMERNPLPCIQFAGRVEGMCQVAFLQKPERLQRQEWLDIWLNSHAQIAIDIQSTFCYRQNIVVVAENQSQPWPLLDAIVEENFPETAMIDRAVFFDSASDEKRYKERENQMIESCMRFIDFDKFDCMPMSEYVIK